MKREFDYEDITIRDVKNNKHLIFICDGDSKKVIVESERNNEHK